MKMLQKRGMWMLILLLACACCLTGCKPSKKKVESSTYYKKLLKKYNKVKKENEKLQEASDSQEQLTDAEKRADKYLAKIARDTLANIEIGYDEDLENSVYITDDGFYGLATKIAERADRTTKYTPEELEKQYSQMYEYILYDEDNAIYEIKVYGSDYVIFSDLPKYVYYVPDASALGDAFMPFRMSYPSSNIFHRMADSPLMTDSKGLYYENNIAVKTANYINQMDKEESSRAKAEKAWKKKKKISEDEDVDASEYEPSSKTYKYYHHGNIMELTMYDRYISILNVDGNRTWYKVSKKDIQGIKDILKQDRKSREASDSTEKTTEKTDTTETSHTKEIEQEVMNENSN